MDLGLLTRTACGHDRNVAPFFAGRQAEVDAFEGAIDDSKYEPQTGFRVFQGAPGCGKTSLLAHLRANAPENRLFVTVDEDDMLTSPKALAQCVNDAVESAPSTTINTISQAIGIGGALGNLVVPGMKAGAAAVSEGVDMVARTKAKTGTRKRLRELELVLICDEAQVLNAKHAAVLRMLHKSGLKDIPSVLVLAGLSRTGTTIRNLDGLSRLSRNAEVNMGLMAEAECMESTLQMLDKCGIADTGNHYERVARGVAAMSQQWPQHLACAQAALARELLRVDRDIAQVDLGPVERETTQDRYAYYRGRLEGHAVLSDARFTSRVVRAVEKQNQFALRQTPRGRPVTELWQLVRLCRETMATEPEESPVREFNNPPEEIAGALIEKGILSKGPLWAEEDQAKRTNDGPDEVGYQATIPSMATWLAEHPGAPRAG